MATSQQWRERESRSPTWIKAQVIGEDGRNLQAFVTNVSAGGSRIKSLERLSPNERVQILIPGLGAMSAIVRWTRGGQAGVQFVPGSDVWLVECEAPTPDHDDRFAAEEGRCSR